MSQISFRVVDQELHLIDMPTVSSGNIQADKVAFTFSSEWDGRTKTAIFFVDEDEPYYQLLDDKDTCIIPAEVLVDKARVHIGVFGVKDETILTSTILRYRIDKGAITTATEGVTPELWDQILAKYNEIDQEIDELTEDQGAFLVAAQNVIQQAYDALSGLQYEIYDMDGGDPTIPPASYTDDIDGGPPSEEAE